MRAPYQGQRAGQVITFFPITFFPAHRRRCAPEAIGHRRVVRSDESGLPAQGYGIQFFKSLIDDVNFFGQMQDAIHPAHARRDDGLIRQFREGGCLGTTMESIQFLNSIIVMRKRS